MPDEFRHTALLELITKNVTVQAEGLSVNNSHPIFQEQGVAMKATLRPSGQRLLRNSTSPHAFGVWFATLQRSAQHNQEHHRVVLRWRSTTNFLLFFF